MDLTKYWVGLETNDGTIIFPGQTNTEKMTDIRMPVEYIDRLKKGEYFVGLVMIKNSWTTKQLGSGEWQVYMDWVTKYSGLKWVKFVNTDGKIYTATRKEFIETYGERFPVKTKEDEGDS